MSYLSNLRADRPPYQKSQIESLSWLANEYSRHDSTKSPPEYEALLRRVGAKPPQIEARSYYLPQFSETDQSPLKSSLKSLSARMSFYGETANQVMGGLLEGVEPFNDLFHVSCTGYVSPSAAQRWVAQNGLGHLVQSLHLYHMGCYAALPALRVASQARGAGRTVEICHTEFCTLHLTPEKPTLEDMVIQTLLADGACAYRMSAQRPNEASLRYVRGHEEILPGTESAMTWALDEQAFRMTLSKDVPGHIKKELAQVLRGKWPDLDLKNPKMIWAIHPGGPRIIDEIAASFELSESQIKYSRQILREPGNMSSATLPMIWREVLKDVDVADGTPVVTMAFGPGLTVSLAQLEVCR